MAGEEGTAGSRPYLITSLAFALTFGATLGTLVLATKTLPLSFLGQVPFEAARLGHGYAQIFGFAALFVMGVALHVVPRFKGAPIAVPQLVVPTFWLQATGATLAVSGALFRVAALQLAGATLLTAAALGFAWVMRRTLASGAMTAQRLEPYLNAGCVWLVLAGVLAMAASTPRGSGLQASVWEAATWGFAASWLFGMSLRIVPAHLGLTPLRGSDADLLRRYYQTAVALWVGFGVLDVWLPLPLSRMVAGVALAGAGFAFILRLGMASPQSGEGAAAADGFVPFVVAGYLWLAVSLLLLPGLAALAALLGVSPPPLVADFGRHAFTLGFLTQMIMGVALRVVPVFARKRLWSPALRTAVLWLLNLAVIVRGLQVAVALGADALWPFVALSGPLALAAFIAFAANIVMSLRAPAGGAMVAGQAVQGRPAPRGS